jgi:hypothetical protein
LAEEESKEEEVIPLGIQVHTSNKPTQHLNASPPGEGEASEESQKTEGRSPSPSKKHERRGLSIPVNLVKIVKRGMTVGQLKKILEDKLAVIGVTEAQAKLKLREVQNQVADLNDLLEQIKPLDSNKEVLPH